MIRQAYLCSIRILLAVLVLASPVAAQDQPAVPGGAAQKVSPPEKPQFRKPRGSVQLTGEYIAHGDVEDDEGSYSITSGGIKASFKNVTLSYTNYQYDFEDVDELPFGNGTDDPWDDLHSIGISYQRLVDLYEKWGLFFRLGASAKFEEELEDSYGGFGAVGFSYKISPKWRLGAGVGIGGNAVDVNFLPAAFASYNLFTQKGVFASVGFPETAVGYAFSRQLRLKVAALIEGNTFRLADDSPVSPAGYYKQFDGGTGLFVDYRPLPFIQLSAGGEYFFFREITLYDEDGDNIDDFTQDDAFGASLKLKVSF